MTVNDTAVTNGSANITLSEGHNTITVVVTAQDGTTTAELQHRCHPCRCYRQQ